MAKQTKALDNPGSKKTLEKLSNIFSDISSHEMLCELRSLSSTLTSRTATFGSVLHKYRDVSKLEDHVGNFTEEIVEVCIFSCLFQYTTHFKYLFYLNVYVGSYMLN